MSIHGCDNASVEQSAMAVVLCRGKILTTNELIYGKEILSLPKGHVEKNETPQEASIRECFEETNVILDASSLVRQLSPYTYEFFTPENKLIRKTLIPFLFEVNMPGDPLPKEERVLSVQWMNVEEFLSRCPYENVKHAVHEALGRAC